MGSGYAWLVFVAMLAEVLLAASCWLTVRTICEHHQKPVWNPNPVYEHNQAALDEWRKRRSDYCQLGALLAGKSRAIAEARRHYIEEAAGYFHAAIKVASNNEHLDDLLNS